MSYDREPLRLLDPDATPSEPLRAVLEAGRAELPDAAHLARLASRLPLCGPPSPPDAPPPPHSPPSLAPVAAPSALGGAVAGAALAVAVIGGAWWHESGKQPISPAPLAATASQLRTEPASRGAAHPLPAPPPSAPDIAPPTSASPSNTASPSLRAPAASAAPLAHSSSEPSPASTAIVAAAEPPSPPGDLESEVALIERARGALGNPAQAIAITVEHEQRFPRGALSQEREVIAIRALVSLGRAGDARVRAERFLSRFPGSAYKTLLLTLVPSLADSQAKRGEAQ